MSHTTGWSLPHCWQKHHCGQGTTRNGESLSIQFVELAINCTFDKSILMSSKIFNIIELVHWNFITLLVCVHYLNICLQGWWHEQKERTDQLIVDTWGLKSDPEKCGQTFTGTTQYVCKVVDRKDCRSCVLGELQMSFLCTNKDTVLKLLYRSSLNFSDAHKLLVRSCCSTSRKALSLSIRFCCRRASRKNLDSRS